MPSSERIPFEGVLNCWNDDHDLPDLLLSISRSAKTGRLQFSNPEGDKTVYVKVGKIVFAESSSQDDGLGQYLLRRGRISLTDYTRVSKLVRPGKRLGALLVEEDVIDASALMPAVIGQVRSIILGLFQRTETWYSFKEMELPPAKAITLDINMPSVILEGVRFVESWRRVSKGVGSLDFVYRRARDDEWSKLKLPPHVQELLGMSAEPLSVADICARATLPDFEACRYLWALRSLGWIERVAAAELWSHDAAITTPAVAPPPPDPRPASPAQTQTAPSAQVPKTAIPARLIETHISIDRPEIEATSPEVAPAPVSDHPEQTQYPIVPPLEETSEPPKEIAGELVETQVFVEPASTPESPAAPPPVVSTGEYMESILEGDAAVLPQAPAAQKTPSGFEALMEDPQGSDVPGPPTQADTTTVPSIQRQFDPDEGAADSFGDVSMPVISPADEVNEPGPVSEPFLPMEPPAAPTVEASVVTAEVPGQALVFNPEELLIPPPPPGATKPDEIDLDSEFRHSPSDES